MSDDRFMTARQYAKYRKRGYRVVLGWLKAGMPSQKLSEAENSKNIIDRVAADTWLEEMVKK